jgi:hypothetical protein
VFFCVNAQPRLKFFEELFQFLFGSALFDYDYHDFYLFTVLQRYYLFFVYFFVCADTQKGKKIRCRGFAIRAPSPVRADLQSLRPTLPLSLQFMRNQFYFNERMKFGIVPRHAV